MGGLRRQADTRGVSGSKSPLRRVLWLLSGCPEGQVPSQILRAGLGTVREGRPLGVPPQVSCWGAPCVREAGRWHAGWAEGACLHSKPGMPGKLLAFSEPHFPPSVRVMPSSTVDGLLGGCGEEGMSY